MAVIAEASVPPENVPLARMNPDTRTGPPSRPSSRIVYSTPRSCGMLSKPQPWTSRAPVSTARAWCLRYMASTNSGSPVRST